MTDSSKNVVWWAEGSWNGVITDRAVMLLPPEVPQELTERLWWLLRSDEGSLTHALDELVMGMGGRLGAIPDFVLAVTTPDVLHMALRGEAEVEVDGRPVDAAGITTWFETTFTSPTTVVAKTPEKAGPILRPASDAVVCASRLVIKGGRDQTEDGEDEDSDPAGSPEPEHHTGVHTDAANDWTDSAEDSPAAVVSAQTPEIGAEAVAAVALMEQTPAAGPEITDDSADGVDTLESNDTVAFTAEAQDAQDPEEGHCAENAEAGQDEAPAEAVVVDDVEQAPAEPVTDEDLAVAATADESLNQEPGEPAEELAAEDSTEEPVEFAEPLAQDEPNQQRHDHSTVAASAPERAALFAEVSAEHDAQHAAPVDLTAEQLAFAASSQDDVVAPEPAEGSAAADGMDAVDAADADLQAADLLAPPPPAEPVAPEVPADARPAPVSEDLADRPGDHDGHTIASLPEDLSQELRSELLNQGATPSEPPAAPQEDAPFELAVQPPAGLATHSEASASASSASTAGMVQPTASALLVPEAPRFGDHDGNTVAGLPEDLVGQLVNLIGAPRQDSAETLPVVTPAESDPGRKVLAAVCGQGHPSPTNYTACRDCGAELNRPAKTVVCPPLGQMKTSSGDSIDLDRPVLVGRRPVADDVATVSEVAVRTLQIPSPNQLISRNHILIELDAWSVLAQDLGNCNGTILKREGQSAVRLSASNPVLLRSGDVLDLGDGQTLTFENLP